VVVAKMGFQGGINFSSAACLSTTVPIATEREAPAPPRRAVAMMEAGRLVVLDKRG
jgi:hypothetical protein